MEGGNPTLDAKKYWNSVRRALLRAKIDRIGLGGYLHLVEGFPDFCDYIEKVADEFRLIRSFHDAGEPYRIKTRVAVLHIGEAYVPGPCPDTFMRLICMT